MPTAAPASTPSLQLHQAHPGNNHGLAPPPQAPHGPRLPVGRSRTPSPDSVLRVTTEKRSKPMDTLRRGIARIDLGGGGGAEKSSDENSHRGIVDGSVRSNSAHRVDASYNGTSHSSSTNDEQSEEAPQTPVRPSAKALGKRRAPRPPRARSRCVRSRRFVQNRAWADANVRGRGNA